jgi:hypothetical protein
MNIFDWLNPFKRRHNNGSAEKTVRPMTARERAILERELRDSARNAMGSPLDMTSSGDGMMGKSANIAMNQLFAAGTAGTWVFHPRVWMKPRASNGDSPRLVS